MPHTVPSRPTKGAVEPTVASTVRPFSSLSAFAGHGLAQGAVDELGAVQRLDQARTFMALVVRGGLGGVEGDLRERLDLGCSSMKRIESCAFWVSQNVLTTRSPRPRITHVLQQVDHGPVPRASPTSGSGSRSTTQDTMNSPGSEVISCQRLAKPICDSASASESPAKPAPGIAAGSAAGADVAAAATGEVEAGSCCITPTLCQISESLKEIGTNT
jgi:hypothetical protein